MKNIILVGNGPSVLQKNMGKEIDSYDCVVRFNNFETQGFEESVGTKCSILARRSCDDVNLWPEEMFEQVLCFVTYCKWTAGMIKVATHLKSFYKNLKVVPPHICASYGRNIGLDQPLDEWASVGALALNYFTEIYDKITIYGFDHLVKNDEGIVKHYFNKPPKDDRFQSGEKERLFTEKLIEQGKVERLV